VQDSQLSPTLYVSPGDEIEMQITNRLPFNIQIPDTGTQGTLPSNYTVCPGADNVLEQGSTNVHFHGMSITPMCGGDQVKPVFELLSP
jgi:FtsP/CotA-like multicopper oxidase with cupredoxin domain